MCLHKLMVGRYTCHHFLPDLCCLVVLLIAGDFFHSLCAHTQSASVLSLPVQQATTSSLIKKFIGSLSINPSLPLFDRTQLHGLVQGLLIYQYFLDFGSLYMCICDKIHQVQLAVQVPERVVLHSQRCFCSAQI